MAAAAASSSSHFANAGPVLNLIYKRIRALRKKLKHISQMEESLSQGKTLNKEQEETFRSKSSILARIDQLEKLRQPLLQALTREVWIALEKKKKEENYAKLGGGNKNENFSLDNVSDMLHLIYFGSVFDVKTLMSDEDNILSRTLERSCFLTHDQLKIDDAAGGPLKEWNLDLISELGSRLLISRPVNSSLSHKKSLEKCVEHAKLWLAHSEQPIEPNSNITYAGLREILNKVLASDYFTTTPFQFHRMSGKGNFTTTLAEYQLEVSCSSGNGLPSQAIVICYVNLCEKQREAYNNKEKEAQMLVKQYMNSLNYFHYSEVLGMLSRLRELCSYWLLETELLECRIEDVNDSNILRELLLALQSSKEDKCGICLCCPSENVAISRCAHVFCRSCIVDCLDKSSSIGRCPLCRQRISKFDIFEDLSGDLQATSLSYLSSKIAALLELLTKGENKSTKAVIFSQFFDCFCVLEKFLRIAGIKFFRLYGALTAKERDVAIKEFGSSAPNGPTVLLASLSISSTEIDSVAMATFYLMEPWWTPTLGDWICQKNGYKIVKMIVKDTIEERMLTLNEKNRKDSEGNQKEMKLITTSDLCSLVNIKM